MQRLVVAYGRRSLTTVGPQRRNFYIDLEWSGIFILKKIMKVYFSLSITGSFINKIISYSL